MSGGSYNYVSFKLKDIGIHDRLTNPTRSVIQTLTTLMADLLHDVEWVDSDDMSPGDEEAALKKFLGFAEGVRLLKDSGLFTIEAVRDLRREFLDPYVMKDDDERRDGV